MSALLERLSVAGRLLLAIAVVAACALAVVVPLEIAEGLRDAQIARQLVVRR